MSEPVKKYVTVIGAQYSHDPRCIVLAVEFENGQFLTQIPVSQLVPNVTNINNFSEEQMKMITKVFCENIVGKKIFVVFDQDLDAKLRDNYQLNY